MSGAGLIDPVALAATLIRCPSVTPRDAGALDALQAALEDIGFICRRLPFGEADEAEVDNLFARIGEASPNFCFAGHTDVVPAGDAASWSVDPFGGALIDGMLHGRGAVDMKGAVACFVAAASRFLAACGGDFGGSISLLITGDEEGVAVNGTRKVLDWMSANGERIDACLVGEPTSRERLGDTVKIGRRGSITGRLTVFGTQGHVAYPRLADNPIPRLVRTLAALTAERLDEGSEHFQPSNLEVTTIDVGNPAENVIPAQARAIFNSRFNDRHNGSGLADWLRATCEQHAGDHKLDITVGGDAFVTPPGDLSDLIGGAVERVLGATPDLSTAGGTSDARFIKDHCPVAELGLVGQTMHKVDERVAVDDLQALTEVYAAILDSFFPA